MTTPTQTAHAVLTYLYDNPKAVLRRDTAGLGRTGICDGGGICDPTTQLVDSDTIEHIVRRGLVTRIDGPRAFIRRYRLSEAGRKLLAQEKSHE